MASTACRKVAFFGPVESYPVRCYTVEICVYACRDIGLAHTLARWQSATTQSLTKFDRREFIDNAERLSL